MGEKLTLKRDKSRYEWETGRSLPALATAKENQKTVADFIKRAISRAGFSARVKVEREYYENFSNVYIKDLGGKFYIKCADSFSDVGGYDGMDSVDVNKLQLCCSDYRSSLEEDDEECIYRNFDDIVNRLAKDLNKYAGVLRPLTKGEAKSLNRAA